MLNASSLALSIARNVALVRTLAMLADSDLCLALRAMCDGEHGVDLGEFIQLAKKAVNNFRTSQLELQGTGTNEVPMRGTDGQD